MFLELIKTEVDESLLSPVRLRGIHLDRGIDHQVCANANKVAVHRTCLPLDKMVANGVRKRLWLQTNQHEHESSALCARPQHAGKVRHTVQGSSRARVPMGNGVVGSA